MLHLILLPSVLEFKWGFWDVLENTKVHIFLWFSHFKSFHCAHEWYDHCDIVWIETCLLMKLTLVMIGKNSVWYRKCVLPFKKMRVVLRVSTEWYCWTFENCIKITFQSEVIGQSYFVSHLMVNTLYSAPCELLYVSEPFQAIF